MTFSLTQTSGLVITPLLHAQQQNQPCRHSSCNSLTQRYHIHMIADQQTCGYSKTAPRGLCDSSLTERPGLHIIARPEKGTECLRSFQFTKDHTNSYKSPVVFRETGPNALSTSSLFVIHCKAWFHKICCVKNIDEPKRSTTHNRLTLDLNTQYGQGAVVCFHVITIDSQRSDVTAELYNTSPPRPATAQKSS